MEQLVPADEPQEPSSRRVFRSLQAARTAEAAGLKALARIAVALGAKDVDPDTIGG